MIVENKGRKETSRLRMVRINTDGILQTSIFWFYLSSWVNSSKQPLANSISSILNKGTIILSSQKFQIVRKSIEVQSLTKKKKRAEERHNNKKEEEGGRGGKEEIKDREPTLNNGKQTKDWGEGKERDYDKINTENSGNQ